MGASSFILFLPCTHTDDARQNRRSIWLFGLAKLNKKKKQKRTRHGALNPQSVTRSRPLTLRLSRPSVTAVCLADQPEAVPAEPGRPDRLGQAQVGHGLQGQAVLVRQLHELQGAPCWLCGLCSVVWR